jgi:hypothetical protein
MLLTVVMPAQAGIQRNQKVDWIPACAGMTENCTGRIPANAGMTD